MPKLAEIHIIWEGVISQARKMAAEEPILASMLHEQVLSKDGLASAMAHVLATQLSCGSLSALELQTLILEAHRQDHEIVWYAAKDLAATVMRDAACDNPLEPLLFFKGFKALQSYRIAHHFWKQGRRFLALWFQSAISKVFAVDIHPAAEVGYGLLVDHATDLVVGETAKIGNNVSILHGVTLGGTGKVSGDRHPKICDGVLIAAHAQLLGNIKIGKGAKIGAGAVVLTDVPEHTTYAGIPAKRVGVPECDSPAIEMSQYFTDSQGN